MHLTAHVKVLLVMVEVMVVMLVLEVESARELWSKRRRIWTIHLAILLLPAGDVLRFIAALGRAVVVAFHRLLLFVHLRQVGMSRRVGLIVGCEIMLLRRRHCTIHVS